MSESYALVAETIADLPCLTPAPQDVPDAPLAVVLHGLGRHKESALTTLYLFARCGLRALAFDARLHGARPGAEGREARLQTDYVFTMAEIVEGTAQDLSLLLDAQGVTQAAVHGVSLGGYVAYAALAADPRLAVGAMAMGSPDWLEPLRGMGLAPGHPVYDAIAARSPLERAAELYPPRPLLLLHGDQDDVVSIAGDRALYDRLRPVYHAVPDRLEFVIYPGLGHLYTDDMAERSAAWIARFLPPPPR